MKIKALLVLLSLATAVSLQAQSASEDFESYTLGDTLTTPLSGGTGWNGAWGTAAAGTLTANGTVSNTTPLAPGADQYLANVFSTTTAGGAMGVGRQLSTGAPTQSYTVTFLWRADALGTFDDANDRFEFYSSNSAATVNSGGTGGNVTTSPYLTGVFGATRGANYPTGGLFGVYASPAVNGAFNAANYYDLGSVATGGDGTTLSLVAGTNYAFTINVHVETLTWDVSVTDGTTTAFSTGLNWWGNTTQSYVAFGARGSAANETRSFSFDNVQVAAVPEPSSVALVALTIVMGVFCRFSSALTSAGVSDPLAGRHSATEIGRVSGRCVDCE